MSREINLYIEDIKDSIKKIEKYMKDLTFDEFVRNSQVIDAVVRNLSIIGEAVKNIPKEVKSKYPDISWSEAIGMRNKIIHEYFDVSEFQSRILGIEIPIQRGGSGELGVPL